MSLLEELNTLLTPVIPVETGVFSGTSPERYVVLMPITDTFGLYADNNPNCEIQEVRLSVFDKGNYTQIKNRIVRILLGADISITDHRYVEREDDTGYFHYAIDVAKNYTFEMEEKADPLT